MPRTRTIPDDRIFAAILRLLSQGGDKAVSFGTVSAAVGLAPPTLVQRFGSRDGMVRAARLAAWDALDARTSVAIATGADKGPLALFKSIGPVDPSLLLLDMRDPDLAQRAAVWRATVESALGLRLGAGQKAKETAALLFAAWQGQALWAPAGDAAFKLKDVLKRLT
ncbi:DNA-binding HTH domain, TetR-type [Paracoccaceae bacterium]|jgi:AcrR family transcriptional regulator